MATVAEWIEGARLRTLPASIAPVLAGTGVAIFYDGFHLGKALLAGVVALALQLGVNFANDYSDGIRGTDADGLRLGPQRLVGSGAATPTQVLRAALMCFGVSAVAGVALVIWSAAWGFLVIGALAIVAAWFYTGGKNPYGYLGLGEVSVFIFFGLVAVSGTVFTQLGRLPEATWWTAIAMGALITAILEPNNVRDLESDRQSGKRTLAVRLGDRGTRWLYVALLAVAIFAVVQVALVTTWWALLGLVMVALLIGPVQMLLNGATGLALVKVLKLTGIATLACGVGLLVGLALG